MEKMEGERDGRWGGWRVGEIKRVAMGNGGKGRRQGEWEDGGWGDMGTRGVWQWGEMEGGRSPWHYPTPPVSEGLGLAATVSSSETPTLIGWLFLPSQFLLGFGEHVLFLL